LEEQQVHAQLQEDTLVVVEEGALVSDVVCCFPQEQEHV